MLSKKLLIAMVALSCVTVVPSYSTAMEKQSGMSMYGAIGGVGKCVSASDVKTSTSGYTLKGPADSADYRPEYNMGYMIPLSIGMSMSSLRLEIEGNYGSVKVNTDEFYDKFKVNDGTSSIDLTYKKLGHWAGLLNVYYDALGMFGMDNTIVPYVAGGLGFARITAGVGDNSVSRNALAYQGKAGVSVGLSKDTRFYVGYKYLGVSDGGDGFEKVKGTFGGTEKDFTMKIPYSSHGIDAGIMMDFSY